MAKDNVPSPVAKLLEKTREMRNKPTVDGGGDAMAQIGPTDAAELQDEQNASLPDGVTIASEYEILFAKLVTARNETHETHEANRQLTIKNANLGLRIAEMHKQITEMMVTELQAAQQQAVNLMGQVSQMRGNTYQQDTQGMIQQYEIAENVTITPNLGAFGIQDAPRGKWFVVDKTKLDASIKARKEAEEAAKKATQAPPAAPAA